MYLSIVVACSLVTECEAACKGGFALTQSSEKTISLTNKVMNTALSCVIFVSHWNQEIQSISGSQTHATYQTYKYFVCLLWESYSSPDSMHTKCGQLLSVLLMDTFFPQSNAWRKCHKYCVISCR